MIVAGRSICTQDVSAGNYGDLPLNQSQARPGALVLASLDDKSNHFLLAGTDVDVQDAHTMPSAT
jgi:hypothetical protein